MWAATASGAPPAPNPDDPLGAVPADCPAFVYTNCVLRVGYVSFKINGAHIYEVGQRMSVTWTADLPASAGGAPPPRHW